MPHQTLLPPGACRTWRKTCRSRRPPARTEHKRPFCRLTISYDSVMQGVPTRCLLFLVAACAAHAAKTLDIYFIDTEGGQATLVVAPSGQTLLIDTGYTGFGGRDTVRIAAAAKDAGVKRIDNLLITHFHDD